MAAVAACTMPAFAQDWPMAVAPAGCKFNWVGTGGFQETTISGGVGHFPTLLTGTEQNWPVVEPLVPFCGEHCQTEDDRWALFELFPLEVGNTIFVGPSDDPIKIEVESFVDLRAAGGTKAYRVATTGANANRTISYWAPDIGWLVRMDEPNFSKVVVTTDCPEGAAPVVPEKPAPAEQPPTDQADETVSPGA
ncbi:MAG: hypothetical protein AAFQ66_16115 [Pseudomonadota bacterium]